MADFFNPANDVNLLHSSIRTHSELSNVVEKVEYEIIDFYSQRPSIPIRVKTGSENLRIGPNSTGIEVQLIGYDPDDPTNSDADLKEALRRSIAKIVEWVLLGYNDTSKVKSESMGRWSAEYITVPSYKEWPNGWNNLLKNFDDREALYSV